LRDTRFTKWATIVGVPEEARGDHPRHKAGWTFLSNHGHVLVCIANDPGIRGREIAARVGITERAAQAIIADLVAEGYVKRSRVGRRNQYEIIADRPLRHSVEQPHSVGELLDLISNATSPKAKKGAVTS
jgi:hypothetical protein